MHQLIKDSNNDVQVIFYSTENNRAAIEKTGSIFRPIKYYPEKKLEQHGAHPLLALGYGLMDFSDKFLPDMIEDVERDRPDLIVYDTLALHAKYLLRSLELRYKRGQSKFEPPRALLISTTFAQKEMNIQELSQMFEFSLSFIMHLIFMTVLQIVFSYKHGLDVFNLMGILGSQKEKIVLVSIFPELQPNREKFDDSFHFIGNCVAEQVRSYEVKDQRLRSVLDSFSPEKKSNTSKKLIYVSMGTVFNKNVELFEKLIDSMRFIEDKENITVLISTGPFVYERLQEKMEHQGYTVPENVILQARVPQIEVLKRASLFITHGGMNSCNEAILYNVPVVVLPIMVDQPLVAKRIAELGIGRHVDTQTFTAEGLYKAMNLTLNDESIALKMSQYSAKTKQYDGNKNGARLILNYLNN